MFLQKLKFLNKILKRNDKFRECKFSTIREPDMARIYGFTERIHCLVTPYFVIMQFL